MRIFLFVLCAAPAAALICFAVTYILLLKTVRRPDGAELAQEKRRLERRYAPYAAAVERAARWADGVRWQDVSASSADGVRLHGYLYARPGTRDTVILVHGYHSDPWTDFAGLMEYYAAAGFDILAVEQRGHGLSGGERISFGVLESRDAQAWAEYASQLRPDGGIYLHGISMGAATVLMAAGAGLPERVRGVVADCAFTTPKDILAYQMTRQYHLPQFPFVAVGTLAGMLLMGRGFVSASTVRAAAAVRLPLLIVHGGDDRSVPPEAARRIAAAAGERGRLLIVPGARHAVSFLHDPETYSQALDAFFARQEK